MSLHSRIFVVSKDKYGKYHEDKYSADDIRRITYLDPDEVKHCSEEKREAAIKWLIETGLDKTYKKGLESFTVDAEGYFKERFEKFKEACEKFTLKEFILNPNELKALINEEYSFHIIFEGDDYSLDNFMRWFDGETFYVTDVFDYSW